MSFFCVCCFTYVAVLWLTKSRSQVVLPTFCLILNGDRPEGPVSQRKMKRSHFTERIQLGSLEAEYSEKVDINFVNVLVSG
jgi:hypothetical protein